MVLWQCHSLRRVHYNSTSYFTRPRAKTSLAAAFARNYTAATSAGTPIARLLKQSAIIIPQSIKGFVGVWHHLSLQAFADMTATGRFPATYRSHATTGDRDQQLLHHSSHAIVCFMA